MLKSEYLKLVNDGINKVKEFPLTTCIKRDHKGKIFELKKLYYELMEINKWLFEPEKTYEFSQYWQNTEINQATKKTLDHNLRYCLLVIHRQLQEIKQDIYEGNIKGLEE